MEMCQKSGIKRQRFKIFIFSVHALLTEVPCPQVHTIKSRAKF